MDSGLSIKAECKDAIKTLEKLQYNTKYIQRKILSGVGTQAKNQVKRQYNTLLHKRSGNLYKSINRKVNKKGDTVSITANVVAGNNATVVVDNGRKGRGKTLVKQARYGYILAYGSHIKAKNKEYLTFKVNGKWVKKKEVFVKERNYMKPPVERYLGSSDYKATVERILQKEIDKYEEKAKNAERTNSAK